jgi:hypothetical protein
MIRPKRMLSPRSCWGERGRACAAVKSADQRHPSAYVPLDFCGAQIDQIINDALSFWHRPAASRQSVEQFLPQYQESTEDVPADRGQAPRRCRIVSLTGLWSACVMMTWTGAAGFDRDGCSVSPGFRAPELSGGGCLSVFFRFPVPRQQRIELMPLVRPGTTRFSTSANQANGSTSFGFAVWISVVAMAQCRPPLSAPAKKASLRLCPCVHKRNYPHLRVMYSSLR